MPHGLCTRDGSVGIVGNLVAGQSASVATPVIGNRGAIVLSHYIDVEIHQALARHPRGHRTHAVRGMAGRTGEAILRYVVTVMGEARVTDDIAQVMALGAYAVRSVETEIGIGKQICDLSTGCRGLAELIVMLEDVRVDRTVRAVWSESTKFAIVVAVVAIAAKNSHAHQAPRRAILIQHVREQAGL